MAQLTLEKVRNDIQALEKDELKQVQTVVNQNMKSQDTQESGEESFLTRMLDAGLITEIIRPNRGQNQMARLASILGKPLSETIIEERR